MQPTIWAPKNVVLLFSSKTSKKGVPSRKTHPFLPDLLNFLRSFLVPSYAKKHPPGAPENDCSSTPPDVLTPQFAAEPPPSEIGRTPFEESARQNFCDAFA